MINQALARQGQNVCRIFQAETHSKAHEKKTPGHLECLFHVLRTHALSRHKEPGAVGALEILMVHQQNHEGSGVVSLNTVPVIR